MIYKDVKIYYSYGQDENTYTRLFDDGSAGQHDFSDFSSLIKEEFDCYNAEKPKGIILHPVDKRKFEEFIKNPHRLEIESRVQAAENELKEVRKALEEFK